jgi:hypothetical protein
VGAGVNIIRIILTSGRVGLGAKLINQARVWSILQPKVWCWCGGWVRCGYILHPSFGLVLGLVLRERIRCKGKGVKITNLNLDIPL